MTEELFRDDSRMPSCQARVVSVGEAGVVLDRTVFYPLGGGQAGDSGALVLDDGRELLVRDTRKLRSEAGAASTGIAHVPAPGQEAMLSALTPGVEVTARIDWARRHRHMRFHTATHLLCALVPHPVDGCSITTDYARLDFHMTDPLDKQALTDGLAALIGRDLPVTHRWITEDELDAQPHLVRSMSVQPPRGMGRVRVIDVAGVDLQPCGGTHVARTGEIGPVVVIKVEKKSAKTRRVVLAFEEDRNF